MIELLLIGMGIALICGVVSLVFNAIEEGVEHIWGTKEPEQTNVKPRELSLKQAQDIALKALASTEERRRREREAEAKYWADIP